MEMATSSGICTAAELTVILLDQLIVMKIKPAKLTLGKLLEFTELTLVIIAENQTV